MRPTQKLGRSVTTAVAGRYSSSCGVPTSHIRKGQLRKERKAAWKCAGYGLIAARVVSREASHQPVTSADERLPLVLSEAVARAQAHVVGVPVNTRCEQTV